MNRVTRAVGNATLGFNLGLGLVERQPEIVGLPVAISLVALEATQQETSQPLPTEPPAPAFVNREQRRALGLEEPMVTFLTDEDRAKHLARLQEAISKQAQRRRSVTGIFFK